MRKPTATQTGDILTQIEQLAARLRTLEPTLRTRAGPTGRDGYPTTSGPEAHHGTGGDPVGNLVALRLDHPREDVLAVAYNTMVTKLHDARRLLEQAESAGRQALPPPTNTAEDGCVSCARIKIWSPIWRTRRCRFCFDWASNHRGEDPPIAILRAHAEGRRITTSLIERITRRGAR